MPFRQSPTCRTLLRTVLLVLLLATSFQGAHARDARTDDVARVVANVMGLPLDVFTYHPRDCASPSILMVFHGNGRGAQSYLESARDVADRACFVIYAPLFDEDRFPNWSYHRGGLVHDGRALPEEGWTSGIVDDLVEWARQQEGRPNARSFLFGHSAGGQFLSRVAAYDLPQSVERIVLANPSTYVLPTEEEDIPYGFGGLPSAKAEAWMRAYLAAPITIYLGSEDTGSEDLTMTEQAIRQGENRLDRGKRTFEAAQREAAEHGWPFNWKLVLADKVGHSGRGMLTAKEMIEALGF